MVRLKRLRVKTINLETFDFGMGKLSNLISKVKSSFEISYEELKLKPHILDVEEKDIKLIEKDVVEVG